MYARLPQVRVVDDRELEALAAVDRQDLDRLGVGLQAAAAVLVARVLVGLGDAPAQPRRPARSCRAARRRRGVQELADVAQVGQPPLAVGQPQHALRQPLRERDRLGQRGDARAAAARAPSRAGAGGRPPTPRRRPSRSARRSSRRTTSAPPRARAPPRSAARAPPAAAATRAPAGVPNTLPAPLITAGMRDRVERVAHQRGGAVRAHEHRDVAGPHGLLADAGVGVQQPHEVGGEVVGHVRAGRAAPSRSRCAPCARSPARRGARRGCAAARPPRAAATPRSPR